MISASPSSLSYEDECDYLPIQPAMCFRDSMCYVPFLAKEGEGVKHKLGGEDGRGGLFVIHPGSRRSFNTLQSLAKICHASDIALRD